MNKRVVLAVIAAIVVVLLVVAWKLWLGGSGGDGVAERAAAGGSAATAAVAQHARAPAVPASLAGKVTRRADGTPIAGAVVSIARAEFGAMFTPAKTPAVIVTTGRDGTWKVAAIPPGTYAITASALGFVPGGQPKVLVGSGETKQGIDVALDAGGTLVRGLVSDVLGGPIANARITVTLGDSIDFAQHAEMVALTGEDGRYQLQLADGAYDAEASHDDYTKIDHRLQIAGKPVDLDFVLTPGAAIRGQVVSRGGTPVGGAIVQAHGGRGGRRSDATTLADADGKFVFRSLGSGAISLTAQGHGYASAQPAVVEVGIGEQVDDVRVVVDRAFSISGTIVKKGKPTEGIPGVQLVAFSFGGAEAMAPEPSDATGAFEIIGVRPASYMLAALGEGVMPEIGGKSYEVVDKDLTGVIVEMGVGVTLSGRVDPPQVAKMGLELQQVGFANMFEAIKAVFVHGESDATGNFTVKNVPPGSFRLTATTDDGAAGNLAVTIADTPQQNLVVKIETRASIAGRVVDAGGAPVAGAHVAEQLHSELSMVQINMAAGKSATTSADGTFKLVGIEPGKTSITVSDGEGALLPVGAKDPNDKGTPFELAKGAAVTGVTITVESRNGVIRGVVIGPDKKPASDAWITAGIERVKHKAKAAGDDGDDDGDVVEMVHPHAPVLTSAEGKFTVDHLRKGTYHLVAEGARGASRADKGGVKPGDTVTIELAPLGTLTGHVTSGGSPVTLYDVACKGPIGTIDRRITAADGGFMLEHLAPGSYTCHVTCDAGSADGKVDVPTGPATLELALVPWSSITGTVVGALDGKPVPGLILLTHGDGTIEGRDFADAFLGKGPVTDPAGRFTVPRVTPGKGSLVVQPADSAFVVLAKRDYTVAAGQRLDLGTIKVVAPPSGGKGTLGLTAAPKDGNLVVMAIKPGGPAEAAGIKVDDKIASIDGHPISEITPEIGVMLLSSGQLAAGQTMVLGLDRGSISVTATPWP